MSVFLASSLSLALAFTTPAPPGTGDPGATQVAWQPDLAAAQEIARREGRPLFLAVNMDGESASERIVREMYRDPAFVALTRHCVCVIGSIFRHTPRDYDDEGRRIPCPRLGEVTCGEHMALEPIVYDEYLGGERIAPRHAYLTPDGTKVFDLFLLFDLDEMRRALAEAVRSAPPAAESPTRLGHSAEAWRVLLFRSVHSRTADPDHLMRLAEVARALGLSGVATTAFKRVLRDDPDLPDTALAPLPPGLLPALGRIDGGTRETRTTLLAWTALGGTDAVASLEEAYGQHEARRIREAGVMPLDPQAWRDLAHTIAGGELAPLAGAVVPTLVEAEAEYQAALEAREGDREDPRLLARVALASRDLARARLEGGDNNVGLLLADTTLLLEQATRALPDDLDLRLELARAHNLQGDYGEEDRIARQVHWALETDLTLPEDAAAFARTMQEDPTIHTMLRWRGDACARLLESRQGRDPIQELEGIRDGAAALLLAAASPLADDKDYQSAAGFFSLLGLYRHVIAVLDEGLHRFPDSGLLRQDLNDMYGALGRPEQAVHHADRLWKAHPESAVSAWYAGYTRLMYGDWLRRLEQPEAAVDHYGAAADAFRACREREPTYADNCRFYEGLCVMSQGFCFLLSQQQDNAAHCLVEGLRTWPGLAGYRDGLDREPLDLLDGALEFRLGRPSPVEAEWLRDQLEEADPGNSLWPRSIADSLLREALRAEGRGDELLAADYLARAIPMAERACEQEQIEANHWMLAQCLTITAERCLAQGEVTAARPLLNRSAPLMNLDPVPEGGTDEQVLKLVQELRRRLGPARPITRPGR